MNKDIKMNSTSNKSAKDIENNKQLIMSSFCNTWTHPYIRVRGYFKVRKYTFLRKHHGPHSGWCFLRKDYLNWRLFSCFFPTKELADR